MEHLAQGEDIQMRPNSTHQLTFLEERNDEVEVLDQGMTTSQPKTCVKQSVSYTTQHLPGQLKTICG